MANSSGVQLDDNWCSGRRYMGTCYACPIFSLLRAADSRCLSPFEQHRAVVYIERLYHPPRSLAHAESVLALQHDTLLSACLPVLPDTLLSALLSACNFLSRTCVVCFLKAKGAPSLCKHKPEWTSPIRDGAQHGLQHARFHPVCT